MFELKVLTHFAAAHQLQMVSEKCENLHGHNWKIEVCVQGNTLGNDGLLIDFRAIKGETKKIMDELDHKFLNDLELESFPKDKPSSENIAIYVAKSLQSYLKDPSVRVKSVSAWESDNACATYICG